MQTYYLNLPWRMDRRAFMEEQFAKLGLSAIRIEAVTPGEVPPADRAAYCHPSRPNWLGVGECACTLSHFQAMRRLLEGDEPYALVLEDDVRLSARLPAFLAELERTMPDFDLLRIETCEKRVRVRSVSPPVVGVDLVEFVGYDSGAAGYVVSRRGAQRVLQHRQSRLRPIDQALFDSNAPMARVLVLRQTVPGLCVQSRMDAAGARELTSDLGNGDARPATEAPWFWRHRFHRIKRALQRDTLLAVRKQWFVHVQGGKLMRIPFLAEA
jgi:glycosyl transferase family 25